MAENQLPQLIREIRGSRSYGKFAQDLGVSYQTPQNWESGACIPGARSFYALLREATPSQRERLEKLIVGNGRN